MGARGKDDKRSEVAGELHASLRFLSDVLNTLPDPVFVKDREHRWIAFNESFCLLLGRTRAEMLYKTDTDFFPPEQVAVFWEHDDKVFASDTIDENEEYLTDATGAVRIISTRKAAFDEPDGQRVLVGVIRDVTVQKQVERALVAATRAKTDFVANISHELRTPLNGILGMAQLLACRPLGAVELEYLEVITTSGNALLALVNDVLDFSKIEAGKLELEQRVFDPIAIVEEACAVFSAAAAQRGLELVLRCAPDLPALIEADPVRLRQIAINLIGNAVKFTSVGEVVIDARIDRTAQGNRFVITVKDTGIGIDAAAKARLFAPFMQADPSVTRKFGGTGLGLAISQRLAGLMGGAVRADGTLGIGCVFTLDVPVEVVQPALLPTSPAAVSRAVVLLANASARDQLTLELARLGIAVFHDLDRPADVVFVDDVRLAELGATSSAIVISVGTDAKTSAARRHLVKPVRRGRLETLLGALTHAAVPLPEPAKLTRLALVVEDNAVSQKVLSLMLAYGGFATDIAPDGLVAVSLAQQKRYDVILMDSQMPELGGVDAAARIRSDGCLSAATPIIAVTADAAPEAIERCLAAGMNAVMHKPVLLDNLLGLLERFAKADSDAR